jgi:hypothetical protein
MRMVAACEIVVRHEVWDDVGVREVCSGDRFRVVTNSTGEVRVLGRRTEAQVVLRQPLCSALFEEQMLCYTACVDCIVIWCFGNGLIVRVIGIGGIRDIVVSREQCCFFAAGGTVVRRYSVSGTEAGVFDAGECITAIAAANPVKCSEVAVAIGTVNGRVMFVGGARAAFASVREPCVVGEAAIRELRFSDDGKTLHALSLG